MYVYNQSLCCTTEAQYFKSTMSVKIKKKKTDKKSGYRCDIHIYNEILLSH